MKKKTKRTSGAARYATLSSAKGKKRDERERDEREKR